jgi:hypothetical protein
VGEWASLLAHYGGVQIDEVGLTMNGLCMVSRGEALFYLEELRFSQKNQL